MATLISSPAPVTNNQQSFITASAGSGQISQPDPVQNVATVDLTRAQTSSDPMGDFIANLPNKSAVQTVDLTATAAGDWRARLQLAPDADYLYNASQPGILAPLRETNGVIFPYTPQIDTIHHANYSTTTLPYSNWNGYHYQGSNPGEIQLQATFTAQDNAEAKYVLAAIHFFKSASKMFYGQDYERGTPPPVLFFSAHGQHQYNRVPVVIKDFNYLLPSDVNYVRTAPGTISAPTGPAVDTTRRRTNPLSATLSRLERLGVLPGGKKAASNSITAGSVGASYVPTKLEITLTLLPMMSRHQMSTDFSLKKYASGELITRGFI